MLTITVLGEEFYDDDKGEFVYPNSFELQFEHSLAALSKWESEFEKPFLGPGEKSTEEMLMYIYFMIVGRHHPPEVVEKLSDENFELINKYINKKMSATWFNDTAPQAKSSEIITSELIYFWMTMFNIPMEAEHWHINRLFNLIKIANIKNSKPKKMSRDENARWRKELNEKRRRELGSSG